MVRDIWSEARRLLEICGPQARLTANVTTFVDTLQYRSCIAIKREREVLWQKVPFRVRGGTSAMALARRRYRRPSSVGKVYRRGRPRQCGHRLREVSHSGGSNLVRLRNAESTLSDPVSTSSIT